ncbi:MAG: fatty acid desaturase [Bacteroidales bacterium]|nr:MAG: fatty acid desaturase [Bacteroidales bacterium]
MSSDKNAMSEFNTSWVKVVMRYNFPDNFKSWWQVVNSVVPYIAIWVLMVYSLEYSYWLTLLLSVFAAGFLVRIFIVFHDCGHGSFFKSERLNRLVGIPLGLLSFTPYHRWHRDHKEHHATVGNLDKRGVGDVKTLTVEEYQSLSKWKKFGYRFYRNPIFLIGVAPLLLFLIQYRLPKSYMNRKELVYLHLSNLALVLGILLVIWAIGWKAYLLIQLPVIYLASVHGVWLFYVQHQYESVKWERSDKWDYKTIAIQGSSYFKLPFILKWFTGNIGFHHIHHLSPTIPNYKLSKCHKENPMFQDIKPITFFSSLKSLRLRLWDEKKQRLVGFNEI